MRKQHIFQCMVMVILASFLFLWGCTENSLTFQVRFPEVSGLKQDDLVYFERNEIGRVKKVFYTQQGDYLVAVDITPSFKNAVTEDSKFYIDHSPSNYAAMAMIVEQKHPGGVILKNGTTVQGSERAGYLDEIFENLQEKAGEVEGELNKSLDNLKKSLYATSQKLDRNLESAIDELSLWLEAFKDKLEKAPDSEEVKQLEERFRQFVRRVQPRSERCAGSNS